MKTLAGVLLTSILLVGCSDSSTDTTASNDSGNGSASGQNSDNGSSLDSSTNDSGSSSDGSADTDGTSSDGTDSGDGSDNNDGSDSSSGSDNTGSSSGGGSSGNDSGSDTGSDTNNTTDNSGGDTDTDNGDGTDSGDGSSSNDSGSGTSEPEPSTVKFTGEDFGYLLIHPSYYPSDPRNPNTIDPREDYTIWATDYIKAQSLLEAMHAINAYRGENQQIKIVNGGTQDLDSLITDYCPTSGDRFAPARCAFYARLAYNKTTAQDGWQIEHRQNYDVPLMCGGLALKFMDCRYSVMGFSRAGGSGYDGPSTGEMHTMAVSPIEAWQYEKNQPKITAINRAATNYLKCTTSDDDFYSQYIYALPALSPWPVADPTWTTMRATQYGTLIVWLLNDDTVEDVYRDVIAEHDGSNLCKATFQLDLKDVQPNATF